jgi:hypothetical protein
MSSVGNNAVTIYNTASSSYLTAPSGIPLHSSLASSSHSQLPGLTFGADPSDNTLAQIYGAVPGNPGDTHTQFTIVKNSDNSIRYCLLCQQDFGVEELIPYMVVSKASIIKRNYWILPVVEQRTELLSLCGKRMVVRIRGGRWCLLDIYFERLGLGLALKGTSREEWDA